MLKLVTKTTDNRQFGVPRPNNCDFETSLEKRCQYCGQNHLRPGYCQALDPINAEKYPHLHGKAVTDSDVTDISVTDKICVICNTSFKPKRSDATTCSDACRTRKRRAQQKD